MSAKQVSDLTRLDRLVQQGQTMHITRIDRDWQTGVAHLVLGWQRGGDDLHKTMHMDETVSVATPEGS